MKRKTKVYHEQDYNPGLTRERVFPRDYILVAEVETNSLDVAFERTNTINRVWHENEGVTVHQVTRSTSVGDVVVLPNGKAHLCRVIGWKLLGRFGDCKKNPVTIKNGLGAYFDEARRQPEVD